MIPPVFGQILPVPGDRDHMIDVSASVSMDEDYARNLRISGDK
jgi:hypothetical protein